MEADSFRRKEDFFPRQGYRSVLRQFFWLMIWPSVTVLLVVGIVYLDRMYTFRAQAIQQESIRLESLELYFQDRNKTIASDLQFLGKNPLLQSYLSHSLPPSSRLMTELFDSFLSGKKFYSQIRLLSRSGRELITATKDPDHSAAGVNPLDSLEESSVFEWLLLQPAGKIFLFSFPQKSSEIVSQAIKADSTQRIYVIVNGSDGKPTGFIALDYDRAELFKTLRYSGQEQFSRMILLDRGTVWGISERPSQAGGYDSASGDEPSRASEQNLSPRVQDDLFARVTYQPSGHFFKDSSLYVYKSINPLPPAVSEVHMGDDSTIQIHENDEPYQWFLATEIPAVYFVTQRKYYLKFLTLLGIALLLPSLFVCFFLAKSRARVKLEAVLRYREHNDHLEQLEAKVQQRTREVEDSNLKLSAEIAERLTAEKQLKLNNELLSGIIGSIDGIVYVADFDSHEILFANEYLKQLFGFDPVGRLCWQFLHANQDGPCSFCTNCRLLDKNGSPSPPLQWEYQNPYNKKWYVAKDQAILWSNGKFVRLEIAIDITEQKRLQRFLQEARKQAELTQSVRSRFVALVAHDLKSPFFSITQMLKRILDRETFTHRVHREFLENIVENGHRMLQMIDNLLAMDRFATSEMKLDKKFFNVSSMAAEVVQNFKHPASEKNLTLVNEIPSETTLYADKYLYYVILNNLVSNAIKFSDREGKIVLSVTDAMHSATIVVEDNGKGMSREYARNLFKADIKTSSQGTLGEQGSGLGLIFCQDIMKAHHGRIHVESQPGIGTSFYVELPRCSSIEHRTSQRVGTIASRVNNLDNS